MALLARALSSVLMCCAALPVQAFEFTLPANAKQTATRDIALDQEAVPTGPFANGTLPVRMMEGPVTRHTYRIPSSGMTPLQILVPIRTQLEAAGYEILLDCDAARCGGFDFRFGIDVLPAPNMYVNIHDFHFISAVLPGEGTAVTLLASAALGTGYLQIVQVGGEAPDVNISNVQPSEPESVQSEPVASPPPSEAPDVFIARLLQNGHAVLHDLDFAVGATTLDVSVNPELVAIATLLQDRPGLRIAVVGHTDTGGGLQTNINVSRARAGAVRSALIDSFDAPADQIDAEGMGYLSPIASNLTPEGRNANRRVEVIVVSDDG